MKLPSAKPQVAGAPRRAGLEPVQPIGSTEQLEAAAEGTHRHEPQVGVALRLGGFDRALEDRQAGVRARVPAERNSQRVIPSRELGTGGLGDVPGCLRLLEDVGSSKVEVVAKPLEPEPSLDRKPTTADQRDPSIELADRVRALAPRPVRPAAQQSGAGSHLDVPALDGGCERRGLFEPPRVEQSVRRLESELICILAVGARSGEAEVACPLAWTLGMFGSTQRLRQRPVLLVGRRVVTG